MGPCSGSHFLTEVSVLLNFFSEARHHNGFLICGISLGCLILREVDQSHPACPPQLGDAPGRTVAGSGSFVAFPIVAKVSGRGCSAEVTRTAAKEMVCSGCDHSFFGI